MPLSETDKAYIAGIVDGEGCITVCARSPKSTSRETSIQYVLTVSIQMCDDDLIRWIHSAIGGIGSVYRYKHHQPNHKDATSLRLGVRDGVILLRLILPYLRLKRRQAELFIEMVDIRKQSRVKRQFMPERQRQICDEFRVLNHRGKYYSIV